MAFALHGRVRETTTTEGTGTYTLAGAVSGFKAFDDVYANGDTMFAFIVAGEEWELIKGTLNTSAGTLARTQVYLSSNSNNAVNWGAGTKEVMVEWPSPDDLDAAGRALLLTALGGDAGAVGFSKLTVTVTSSSAVAITARKMSVEASDGTVRWLSSVNVTANLGSSGANGRDTGSEASNTWYNVYVIYNPSTDTVASLLSTSATSPTLPSGYTYFARVGVVRNDGSSNLLDTIQRGERVQYVGSDIPSLDTFSGSESISSLVPPTAVAVAFISIYAQSGGSAGAGGPSSSLQFGNISGTTVYMHVDILMDSAQTIYGGGLYQVFGWTDSL